MYTCNIMYIIIYTHLCILNIPLHSVDLAPQRQLGKTHLDDGGIGLAVLHDAMLLPNGLDPAGMTKGIHLMFID